MYRFLLIIGVIFFLSLSPSELKASTNQTLNLLEPIKNELNESTAKILQGKYSGAEEITHKTLEELIRLREAVMPLQPQIQKLVENQVEILQTTKQQIQEGTQEDKKLLQKQRQNIDKTLRAKQLAKFINNKLATQKTKEQTQEKDSKKIQRINKIRALLGSAYKYQKKALTRLTKKQWKNSLPKQEKALEKLKEALDLFEKNQDQQKQKSQKKKKQKKNKTGQNSKQNQESQDKKEQQQNKKDQNSKQKQASQDKKKQQENKKGQNSKQKQGSQDNKEEQKNKTAKKAGQQQKPKAMTSKEALRELYRIMNERDSQKKQREKRYGVPRERRKIPVEKDW